MCLDMSEVGYRLAPLHAYNIGAKKRESKKKKKKGGVDLFIESVVVYIIQFEDCHNVTAYTYASIYLGTIDGVLYR